MQIFPKSFINTNEADAFLLFLMLIFIRLSNPSYDLIEKIGYVPPCWVLLSNNAQISSQIPVYRA